MDDREIIADFVIESREHLADIENQLLAIEAGGADPDLAQVNTVFRAIHSVKGAAGFLGFSTVGQLAHDLENVLNLIRNRQLVPSSAVTDVMLRSADRLRDLINCIDQSNEADVSQYIAALQRIVAGEVAEEEPQQVAAASEASTTPESIPLLDETPASEPVPECPVLDSPPCESQAYESPLPEDLSLANPVLHDAVAAAAPTSIEPPPVEPPEPAMQYVPQPPLRQQSPIVETPQGHPMDHSAIPAAPAAQAAAGGGVGETSIRVAVNVLDRLMNLAGELVLSRNQLLQTLASSDRSALGPVAARVNQVTSELQETIMQTRLQSIGTIFGRFPRVVRDLSNTLGKHCQLTIEGQEVELDKSIIEAVGDPLTHLIRNAVDHGIEPPEARLKAKKPAVGTLALRAFHQAGKVKIQISDDGRGIDAARLKEKAVAKGLLTAEQARAMSDREALQLIFRPGFSMAERVTEVSGRGVGMDVVKTNIERLGGSVAIETQPGKGTTIDVKLPLTLAIIPSLVVRSGVRRYAIPQASIRELVRVKADEAAARIEKVQHAEVFRLRGALLPLIRLNNSLALQESNDEVTAARAVHIIVVEAGHLRYGLIVDGLCDSEEIVVKPLGRHMKGCSCLAGATILGDGRVALILDIAGIASYSRLAIPDDDAAAEAAAAAQTDDQQTLLLFTNHPTEYFGIPMELVARLERVRTDQIDSVGGQQILQYRGGTLPLLSLEQTIACKPREECDKIHVIVFTAADREIGLLVPQLLDIRSVAADIDTATLREPGILGSLVHEKMTVRLVDLHEMTRKAHPDWYDQQPAAQTNEGGVPRILLAEDSDFFRKQLSSFLESEGYEIHACEDGAVAWAAAQDPENHFDMVVTDIEMPNMTGLELTQRIREHSPTASVPIIAVTSLAGEDDIRRGQEMGVNEYHIKLDRDQLLAAVMRLLKASLKRPMVRNPS